jgi:hypothetical protein
MKRSLGVLLALLFFTLLTSWKNSSAALQPQTLFSLIPIAPASTVESPERSDCGPFLDPQTNPYDCFYCYTGGCCQFGNCVWWPFYKRDDLSVEINGALGWGSASDWLGVAEYQGYGVCSTAKTTNCPVLPGAIAWWSGHVAYVESANPLTVSEMDCYQTTPNYPPPSASPQVWLNQGTPIKGNHPDGYIYGLGGEPVTSLDSGEKWTS